MIHLVASPALTHDIAVDIARAMAPPTCQLPARGSTTIQSLYINSGSLWERLCIHEELTGLLLSGEVLWPPTQTCSSSDPLFEKVLSDLKLSSVE